MAVDTLLEAAELNLIH